MNALRTRRLLLRPFTVADSPALMQAMEENLAHLRAWMEWALREPAPREEVEARLARWGRDFDAGDDWIYAMLDASGERLVGAVGVHVRGEEGDREIGYWLRADCEGRGYMTEAVDALTRAAFERHGARRVIIRCDPNNARSAAVARRCGYRHEATRIADAVTTAGEPRDTMIWVKDSLTEDA
jgi:RimJ/RimL family protein N-acetyltransferase